VLRNCRYALLALTLLLRPFPANSEDQEAASLDAVPPQIDVLDWFSVPGEISGSVSFATHYVSRGFDTNRGRATPQFFVEYAHPDGYYGNFFATRMNYFGILAEMDFSTGYRSSVDDLSYDIGYYYYYYPNVPRELHVSYHEIGVKLAYDTGVISPFVEAYVSNDYFFGAGRSLFLNAGPDVKLPWDVQGALRIGHLFVEDKRKYVYPPYNVWLISLSKELFGLTFGAQYSAMTIKFDQCLYQNVCGNKFTFRVAKSF
jgi:uncharacterized protein (TIGR02001 family)